MRTPKGRQGPGYKPRAAMGGQTMQDMRADAGTRRGAQSERLRLTGEVGVGYVQMDGNLCQERMWVAGVKIEERQQRPLLMGGR